MFMIVKDINLYDKFILFCPFDLSCNLPQTQSICKFPNYKVCPEFQEKEIKLKHKCRYLH